MMKMILQSQMIKRSQMITLNGSSIKKLLV